MDPQETLCKADAARDDGEYIKAIEHANDYYQWRCKGGLEPPGGDALADAIICAALDGLET